MKLINTLIMLLGHAILASLHFYTIILNKGLDGFQMFSFMAIHAMWQDFYAKVIKKRIYGSK
jgi:hypothetical protein